MKKLILLAMVLLHLPAFSQEKTLETASDIYQVNLFIQGAQVKRKAEINLDKGITRVVLQGITSQLDPNSIQVGASSGLVILSVTHKSAVLSNPKKLPIIKMLEDSLEIVSYQIEEEKNLRFVLDQEQSLLLANKDLKGDKGVNLIDLEDALVIYKKQLTTIRREVLESNIRESKLNQRKMMLQVQLADFKASNQQPSYEILVIVSTALAQKNAFIDFSYFVQGASWNPLYDIRVKDLKSPVALQYKAEIRNNSGENWDNVKLHLSSGNPNLSGIPPVLNTQGLYFGAPTGGVKRPDANGRTYQKMDYYNFNVVTEESMPAQVEQKNTSFEFVIPVQVNLVANNQAQAIDLVTYQLNGHFSYFAVPKMEKEAFLLTSISGWEDLNLLIGNANIYFEGTFVGTSFIDPTSTKDTLDISLGRDRGVVIQRTKLKEFCSSNFSGSKKKEVLMYQITVRNTKKEAITIIIEDQVPVSSNKDIVVETTELSGGELKPDNGKVIWKITIPPGETVNLKLGFDVKYPKDQVLFGL